MVEIRAAIQRARPGKAASNHVPMEAYKALLHHPHALQPLLHLFNRILLNSHADLAAEQSNIEADDPTPAPPPRGPAEETVGRRPTPAPAEAQNIPTWEETARALDTTHFGALALVRLLFHELLGPWTSTATATAMDLYRRARGVLPFVLTFIRTERVLSRTPLIIRTVDQ